MKRTRYIAIVAAVLAALTLASCQDFFTSSFASWAQRDPSVPSGLTADQAMSIADQAVANRDTALARALLPQMAGFVGGSPSAALVASAVDTAVLATGIGEAFGNAITTIGTSIIENGTISGPDIATVAALVASVSVNSDAFDVFDYINTVAAGGPAALAAAGITAADCAMAAAALLVQQAKDDGETLEDLLNGSASLTMADPNYQLALDLLGVATVLDPSNPLVTLSNGWL